MLPPMTAKLLESSEIAPDVRHFVFEVQDAESFSYVPGQFVSFTADIGGSPITRAYSMASPPGGRRFELCLNRVLEGHLSPYLFDLKPGDQIQATGQSVWVDFAITAGFVSLLAFFLGGGMRSGGRALAWSIATFAVVAIVIKLMGRSLPPVHSPLRCAL